MVAGNILHVVADGHGLPLIKRARSDGAKVIAEMVNTHASNQREIYLRECAQWGIRPNFWMTDATGERIDEEGRPADLILVPAGHVRESFISNGFDADKFVTIPFGANVERFFRDPVVKAKPDPAAPLKVISVGQIGLRKGQLYLIEAARRLGPKVVDLTMVGRINADIVRLVEPYRSGFTYHPHVPNDELRALLSGQDVFVLPSLEEGMAVANCEALASGLCVVTTVASGAGEVIQNGQNGFLIEAASIEAIMEQLLMLHANRDLVAQTGEAASLSMRAYGNWQVYAERLSAVYDRLVAP